MNILQKIAKSIYGPELYADLANQPTSSSIKYYLKFLLLLTLVSTIILSATFISFTRSALTDEKVAETIAYYPADLTLKAKDGVFVTNVTEPYKIPFKEENVKEGEPQNIVVIDTKVDAVSLSSFEAYDTLLLINKDSVIATDDNSLKITPAAEYFNENFELNQATIQSFVSDFLPIVRSSVWFSPILIYLALYSAGVFVFIVALFWALCVWLFLRFMKKNQGYKHAYRVTIHAMTLGLTLNLFIDVPLLANVFLILIVVFVNFHSQKSEVVATS